MTDREKELAGRYPVSALIVAMAERAWAGSRDAAKIEFPLADGPKAKLEELLGRKINKIFITDSDVRHIKKRHGQGQASQGQVDITPEDLGLIPAVMNEFDEAVHDRTDRKGNNKLLFVKRVNGAVYTAGVERGNSQIGVITLWKTKARSGA